MKTKSFFASFLFFLFFAIYFFSCKKTETENPQPFNPIKILFEDYSLEGTKCQWKNLSYKNTVVVINSKEELEQYVLCEEDTVPPIDFANFSLLLASGRPYNRVLDANVTDFEQYASDKYKLDVELILSDTAAHEFWVKSLIVKKIPTDSKVRVNLSAKEKEIVYPIDLPYIEYSLEGTQCKWTKSSDVALCGSGYFFRPIVRNEELQKYIITNGDTYPEIDFSKYTLLLTISTFAEAYRKAKLESLLLTNEQHIELRISISLEDIPKSYWAMPILINKKLDNYPVHIFVEYNF